MRMEQNSSSHWLAFTSRLAQTLLDPLRLLPQVEQVPWLQFPCQVRRRSGGKKLD